MIPPHAVALGKKSLIWSGPYGIACYLCGMVFVDRSNKEKARATMDEAVKQIIRDKV